MEYLEIAIRERFLQALVDSGADGINITQADVDQKSTFFFCVNIDFIY